MKRRRFIALLGGVAALPLAARAQQSMRVVGYLGVSSTDRYSYQLHSLREGLREAGYIEDQNLKLELRWAEGRPDLLPALAADLVRSQVD